MNGGQGFQQPEVVFPIPISQKKGTSNKVLRTITIGLQLETNSSQYECFES